MRQRQGAELQQRRGDGTGFADAKDKAPQESLLPVSGDKRSMFVGAVILMLALLLFLTLWNPEEKDESVLSAPSAQSLELQKREAGVVNVDNMVRKGIPAHSLNDRPDEGGGAGQAQGLHGRPHHAAHGPGAEHAPRVGEAAHSAYFAHSQPHGYQPGQAPAPELRRTEGEAELLHPQHPQHGQHGRGESNVPLRARASSKKDGGFGDNEMDGEIMGELENMDKDMKLPFGDDLDEGEKDESDVGEGEKDLELDDEDADFAHHIDDEEEPDDDTLEDMSDAMFDEMDINPKDDQISWPEFWAVTSRENPEASKEEEKELFDSIDHNHDGYIDRQELKQDWKRDDLQFLTGGKLDAAEEEEEKELESELDKEEQQMSNELAQNEGRLIATEMHSKKKRAAEEKLQRGRGPKPSSGSTDKTLGQTISETALKLFKQRAPKPRTLSVKLFQAPVATWSQADRQCKKTRQRICPSAVVEQMRLCEDKDPHHKNRWVPLSENGHWLDLKACRVVEKSQDVKVPALVACC